MSGEILVIGSLNMDQVVVTPRLPLMGETVLGNSYSTYPGGKGANQAISAARLGASVRMVGCIGQDTFGQSLRDNLVINKVDVSHLKVSPNISTGTALITVDQSGRNTIIVVPGANFDLLGQDIDALEKTMEGVSLVVVQMEIPLETVWESILLARKHAIPVVLNPAPANALPDNILNGLDYLIPNESELSLLTNRPTGTLPEIRSACAFLLSKGVKRVILTRGEDGCYYVDKEGEILLPAFTVDSVDSTAAGDAFIGGFASSIVKGKDVQTALITGAAAGALSVTRAGAQTSLPTRQELENFLQIQK
jgi:ribokinase